MKSLLPEIEPRPVEPAGRALQPAPAAVRVPAFAIECALAELLIAQYDRATARRVLGRIVVH